MNVTILGIGSYLPDEIRTNDWWPDAVVAKWTKTAVDSRKRIEEAAANAPTPGQKVVLEAMLSVQNDPFRGVKQRHVLPKNMLSSDMEVEAAKRAIAAAKIDPNEVDVLLTHSMLPDDLMVPNALAVHERLHLRDTCFATTVEGTCNSFLLELGLARQQVASGEARYAVLVQSSGLSRLIDTSDPQSAWFGDGATAVVIGPSTSDAGILGRFDVTDSRLRRAIVTGVPERKWWEEGRSYFHAHDRKAAYEILLGFADYGKRVVEGSLQKANLPKSEVSFFACHQAQIWQRRVAQEFAGLSHAKALDTFEWAGNLAGANLPLVLEVAEREGVLRSGDLVSMYAGGAGVTVSGLVMKWGR